MTAIETVEKFLEAWRDKKQLSLEQTIQKTWLAEHEKHWFDFMRVWFLDKDLKKWKVLKDVRVGDACRDVKVNVTFGYKGKTHKRRLSIRVVCETGPYKPDINGKWGINPISAVKNLN